MEIAKASPYARIADVLPEGMVPTRQTALASTPFTPAFCQIDVKRKDGGKRVARFTVVDATDGSGRSIHVRADDMDQEGFLQMIRALPSRGACDRVTFQDSATVKGPDSTTRVPLTLLTKFADGKAWYEREGIRCSECEAHRATDSFQDVHSASMRHVTRFAWECLRHLLPDTSSCSVDEETLLSHRDGETLSRVATRISSVNPIAADDAVAAYRQYASTRTKAIRRRLAHFLQMYGIDKHDKDDFVRSASPAQGDWLATRVPLVTPAKSTRTFGRAAAKSLRHGLGQLDDDASATAEVLQAMHALGLVSTPTSLHYAPARRTLRRSASEPKPCDARRAAPRARVTTGAPRVSVAEPSVSRKSSSSESKQSTSHTHSSGETSARQLGHDGAPSKRQSLRKQAS